MRADRQTDRQQTRSSQATKLSSIFKRGLPSTWEYFILEGVSVHKSKLLAIKCRKLSGFWATVTKRFALCYGTIVLSVMCVCNVRALWLNGSMDQDVTRYGGRPRPRRHCVRWGPSSPHGKGHSSLHFSAHVYCGQTVAHVSNCWALVRLFCHKLAAANSMTVQAVVVVVRPTSFTAVELHCCKERRCFCFCSFCQTSLVSCRNEIWHLAKAIKLTISS